MPANNVLAYRVKEFKGSRLRCLLATHRSPADVARFLCGLVAPAARVTETDNWFPKGFLHPREAKLGETVDLLGDNNRTALTNWWLANPARANTPNWDLASTFRIADNVGVLLIEAKAHVGELMDDCCGAKDPANYRSIEDALAGASRAWNQLLNGFSLTSSSHYQLSNRFAFAWKLATMRIPVVLVYLGFLNAMEMKGKERLRDHAHWQKSLIAASNVIVPQAAWNRTFDVDGTPLTVLIRSAEVRIEANAIVEKTA